MTPTARRASPSSSGAPAARRGARGVVRGSPLRRAQRDADGTRREARAERDRRAAALRGLRRRERGGVHASSSATRRSSSRCPSTRPSSTSPARRRCSETPRSLAKRIRAEIRRRAALPASAGIAEVKFVAKIASDSAKPDGQKVVPAGHVEGLPRAAARLALVGRRAEDRGALLKARPQDDRRRRREGSRVADEEPRLVGPALLGARERDRSARPSCPIARRRASARRTRSRRTCAGKRRCRRICMGRRCASGGGCARRASSAACVQLTVKYDDFQSITRRKTLEVPTDDGQVLYREARGLLSKVDLSGRFVSLACLGAGAGRPGEQLGLFAPEAPPKNDKLNAGARQDREEVRDQGGGDRRPRGRAHGARSDDGSRWLATRALRSLASTGHRVGRQDRE
jgi:hypothetical protein